MSIKKRAICNQKVAMSTNVFRCPKCGHIDVSPEQSGKEMKCTKCDILMESVSNQEAENDSSKDLSV